MKILIVLLRLRGGVGRANTEIASALKKMGHEVKILSREDHLKKFSLIRGFFPLRRKIRQIVKNGGFDIVYTQDYSMALPLLYPYKILRKKHFCCFCGVKSGSHPELVQWHHKFLQRKVGKIMRRRLVVIGDQLKRIFPWAKLIYRGVNIKEFRPLKRKRISLGWIDKDIELISEKEIQFVCEKTGLKLFIARSIPPGKMNEFYNECKVFVDIPRTAGFNLAWLEAMSAGVPIIIGNKKGAGSVMPFDKVLKSDNKVERMIEIINKPKKINYRDWIIKNNFTWEDKAKELVDFFEDKLK